MNLETEDTGLIAYRIGFWTHCWWGRKAMWKGLLLVRDPHGRKASRTYYAKNIVKRLKLIRRPHRPWQAETDNVVWAARAWTKKGAENKVRRWWVTERDITKHEARYGPKPWLRKERRGTLPTSEESGRGA